MNATYTFYCPHCKKRTQHGDGQQSYAIFIPNYCKPRTYELCKDCTELLHRFLEGEE